MKRGRSTISDSRGRGGFTMVETVICVVIVSGMLVASLEMLGTSARLRRAQGSQNRSLLLARQLMAEIVQQSYQDSDPLALLFGPELGETRATYDDVDDYNGLSESPPKTPAGDVIPGFAGWTRSVTVEYANPNDLAGLASLIDQDLKRITVTVTAPGGRVTRVVGLRSKYSAYEKIYTSSASYPAWASITVQVGSDPSTKVTTSVNTINQVP